MSNRKQANHLATGVLILALGLTLYPSRVSTIQAASSTLVVSEVMYDPVGVESDREWIEIYNLGNTSVELADYKVGDEETSGGGEGMMRFPSGVSIAPGQVIIVARNARGFSAAYGFDPDYEMAESNPAVPNMEHYSLWASGSVALHNDSDEVLLLDPSDSVVDAVSWGSSTFAFDPAAPDVAEGHSLERYYAGADADAASDWVDRATPAPGNVILNLVEVVSSADDGPGTLRDALNAPAFGDAITFDPAVFPPGSPVTISLQTALPELSQDSVTVDASNAGVVLDGSAITDTEKNGMRINGATGVVIKGLQILHFPDDGIEVRNRAQKLVIGGSRYAGLSPLGEGNLLSGNGDDGLFITGTHTSGIVIKGNLVSSNGMGSPTGDGIYIAGPDTSGVIVEGNTIGVNPQGTGSQGNADDGIHISLGAHRNVIGGSTFAQRNLIGGNGSDGVFLTMGAMSNTVCGNYIGTDASGTLSIPNGDDGVHLSQGVHHNRIGGTGIGEGNLISGNTGYGVYLRGVGTRANEIQGNTIGTSLNGSDALANARDGVHIAEAASENTIGGLVDGAGNLISGNGGNGVLIVGQETLSNHIVGNLIGTSADGDARLGNAGEGIKIDAASHDNQIAGNVISGNGWNGLIIVGMAHHNLVYGNFIGTDKTGSFTVGGQPAGGIDLASGAHHNVIGGPTAAERNVISGNGVDGIFIEGGDTTSNTIQGNTIGMDGSGLVPVPNDPWGVFILNGAPGNLITGNLIAGNVSHGLEVTYSAMDSNIVSNTISTNGGAGIHFTEGAFLHRVTSNTIAGNNLAGIVIEAGCAQNTLTGNSIYGNGGQGIQLNGTISETVPAPVLTVVATDTITGTTVSSARVEFFSDDEDEGRIYEGFTVADASGVFSYTRSQGFAGPNVTATSIDADGNTSEFSLPAHLLWTILLYLNGDNDLEEYMFDTLTNTVESGPSPLANVLVLLDGYTTTTAYSETVSYDITRGRATVITSHVTTTGERNMGDGQTLVDFVVWGQNWYPAYHTLLAIVDHGGGWAPESSGASSSGAMARHTDWFAGNSGLSWDFSSDYDYLDSQETRQAMADITEDGAEPLDVVFYDVCLMGMVEVAYQIKDYASFFVSSQNIGWAPLGPGGRYVRAIQGIGPTATPRDVAALLIQTYAEGNPPNGHPFTISAVDQAALITVTTAVDQLAVAISQTLVSPERASLLHEVYSATQKVDYDADFRIEAAGDGFVDLYDFAVQVSRRYTEPAAIAAAHAVTTALETAVVAEEHLSGSPWPVPGELWDLDDVHGLSIFLPLGEDLELPILITETSTITPDLVITRNLRLRDMYTGEQLQFVADTRWSDMIASYYEVVSSPVPTDVTDGPAGGLLEPDIVPPRTAITVTGVLSVGEQITVTWVASDTQTGVGGATLWHQPPGGQWASISAQTGSSGAFTFTLSEVCLNSFAVQAYDGAGNVEPFDGVFNAIVVKVRPCQPELRLSKSVEPKVVEVGGTLTYTLLYSNTGNFQAEGVVITDTLPPGVTAVFSVPTASVPDDGMLVWQVDSLAADGLTHAITVVVKTNDTVTDCWWLTNGAIIESEGTEPVTAKAAAWVLPVPDLQLVRLSQPRLVVITNTLPYTITYAWRLTNMNPCADIVMIDVASFRGWNWQVMTPSLPIVLPEGEAADVWVRVVLSGASGVDRSQVTDTLVVSATSIHDADVAMTSVVTTMVVYRTELDLTKTVCQATVRPGERLTYTLTYSNTGDFLAEGVVITDTLPPSVTVVYSNGTVHLPSYRTLVWEVGKLAANRPPQAVTVAVVVSDTVFSGTRLTNTARIVGTNAQAEEDWAAVEVRFCVYLPIVFRDS